MNASKIREPGDVVPPVIAFKKQDRAIRTREELTDAARRIFARDGFELTRVEDIAAAAGRTRGAFYANFSDKEDVFFAIFEEDLSRDREQVRFSEASSAEDWIDLVARHLATIAKNRPRMQLVLEFKQYAIRHPRKQKRLADLHAAMCAQCAETDLARLLPGFANAGPEKKRSQSAQVGAILDGLALNCMFYDDCLTDEQMVKLLKANLRVVLGLE